MYHNNGWGSQRNTLNENNTCDIKQMCQFLFVLVTKSRCPTQVKKECVFIWINNNFCTFASCYLPRHDQHTKEKCNSPRETISICGHDMITDLKKHEHSPPKAAWRNNDWSLDTTKKMKWSTECRYDWKYIQTDEDIKNSLLRPINWTIDCLQFVVLTPSGRTWLQLSKMH